MTHEEKKAAVLAECERLCPEGGEFEFHPKLWVKAGDGFYSILHGNNPLQGWGLCRVYIDSSEYTQVEIAYRLLGLNTPPADPKWDKLKAKISEQADANEDYPVVKSAMKSVADLMVTLEQEAKQ
jgi:hypothetical protein